MASSKMTLGIDTEAVKSWLEKADMVPVIRCKDCEYGEQDEIGRWFCRNFGCQVGNDDGSGFCADGERREDE